MKCINQLITRPCLHKEPRRRRRLLEMKYALGKLDMSRTDTRGDTICACINAGSGWLTWIYILLWNGATWKTEQRGKNVE